MEISDKHNLKFLDLKSIGSRCSVKIIHVKNEKIENIKSLLMFNEDSPDFCGELVDLHYVGEKDNGRARLARCKGTSLCDLCEASPSIGSQLNSKPFSKVFFYGIHNNELVYFSLTKGTGFQVIKALMDSPQSPLDLKNKTVFSFSSESKFVDYPRIKFEGTREDKTFRVSRDLVEKISRLPNLKSFLNEKYPLDWNEDIIKEIK